MPGEIEGIYSHDGNSIDGQGRALGNACRNRPVRVLGNAGDGP